MLNRQLGYFENWIQLIPHFNYYQNQSIFFDITIKGFKLQYMIL